MNKGTWSCYSSYANPRWYNSDLEEILAQIGTALYPEIIVVVARMGLKILL